MSQMTRNADGQKNIGTGQESDTTELRDSRSNSVMIKIASTDSDKSEKQLDNTLAEPTPHMFNPRAVVTSLNEDQYEE